MNNSLGAFIIDLEDKTLSSEEKDLLNQPLVGGVILFSRNYDSRDQLTALCHDIRHARQEPPLIMVDQEGGRVQRFRHEFTAIPSMGVFGELYQHDPDSAQQVVKDCGWLMASELLSVGVDLSLAPILDMNKKMNNVIGDRAFHSDPNTISTLAGAFVKGMQEAGMAATGKHFPGHGSVTADSHVAMPVDPRSFAEVEKEDMVPFVTLIKSGITALMAAHVRFPNIDDLPVGYSPLWLQTILRERLGFAGVIISDDLNMEGANISASYEDRFIAARKAGCDFVLLCNNRPGVLSVINQIKPESHRIANEKWQPLQGRIPEPSIPLPQQQRWQDIRRFLHRTM